MKQNIIKLSLYGIVSILYTCAFLFGAMYPQYGIPRESVVYETRGKEDASVTKESSFFESSDSKEDDDQDIKIVYRSYFYEKIKELL